VAIRAPDKNFVSVAASSPGATSRVTGNIAIPPGALVVAFLKQETSAAITFTLRGPSPDSKGWQSTTTVINGAAIQAVWGICKRGYSGPVTAVFSASATDSEFAVGYFTGIDQDNPFISSVSGSGSSTAQTVGPLDNNLSPADALYVWAFGAFGPSSYSAMTCGGDTAVLASQANNTLGVFSYIAKSPASRSGAATDSGNVDYSAWMLVFRAAKTQNPIRAKRRTTPGVGGITADLIMAIAAPAVAAQADAGITADLAATVSALVAALQADVGVSSDLAATLNALAFAAQADVGVAADLAATLSTVMAAQADVGITADLAAALSSPDFAGQADVGVAGGITATLTTTLASPDAALQADVGITADLAATLTTPFAAQADVGITGALAAPLAAPVGSAQADVGVGADLAAVASAPTLSAQANVAISGDLAANLAALAAAVQADVGITADMQAAISALTAQLVEAALYSLFTRRTKAALLTDGRTSAVSTPSSLQALLANNGTTQAIVLDE
jgi:hypothetical protein